MVDPISPVTGITNPPADQTDDHGYYAKITIGKYERNPVAGGGDSAFKLKQITPKYVLLLPLPTELRDDTSVNYTNVNLETVGDFIQDRPMLNSLALRSAGNVIEAGLGSLSSGFKKLESMGGGIGAGLVDIAKSMFPAEQINSAIQQTYGVAPNPNPSVQFQGPVLRDFSLTWAFYPKNEEESRKINDMIKKLKSFALPSKNEGNKGAILNYPHICQLNFFPWDGKGTSLGDNGWTENSIIRIKKCFMSSVNANYHPFGTPAFFEGTQLPVSYQLTINFKEIEYLLADDWDSAGVSDTPGFTAGGLIGDFISGAFSINTITGAFDELRAALPQDWFADEAPPTPGEQKVADLDAIKGRGVASSSPLTITGTDGTTYLIESSGVGGRNPTWHTTVTTTAPDGTVTTKRFPESGGGGIVDVNSQVSEYMTQINPWGVTEEQQQ